MKRACSPSCLDASVFFPPSHFVIKMNESDKDLYQKEDEMRGIESERSITPSLTDFSEENTRNIEGQRSEQNSEIISTNTTTKTTTVVSEPNLVNPLLLRKTPITTVIHRPPIIVVPQRMSNKGNKDPLCTSKTSSSSERTRNDEIPSNGHIVSTTKSVHNPPIIVAPLGKSNEGHQNLRSMPSSERTQGHIISTTNRPSPVITVPRRNSNK